MKAKCVLDRNVIEITPMADSPDCEQKIAVMSVVGVRTAVDFLRTMKGQPVALPACWRMDLLNLDVVMAPIDADINADTIFAGGDFSDLTMDNMVSDFLDVHEQINNYLVIQEKSFTPEMVDRLKELYFYLPVEYFSPEMLTTYQYAAFAWGLGLPFYTRNTAFCAAINPQICQEYSVLVEPAPERRLMYQAGSNQENDEITQKLAWVHLLADKDEERRVAHEFLECVQ